ncbi:MAG: hypothetical protein HC916_04300 [Coleofasciculaceae cyanobacterium SM2_1_6]|nr:hypothetical protein [Coleofasciculaceae cyanobacterium SM2_1_6]
MPTLRVGAGFYEFDGFLKAFVILITTGLVTNLIASPIIAEVNSINSTNQTDHSTQANQSNQSNQTDRPNSINTQVNETSQSLQSTQSIVNLPLELDLINQPDLALERGIITADTVSQEGITNPSLWWVRDQFGRQIVINWLIYPQEKRIDLVVDRQIWSFINYIEKYSLINHFAINAREYGYNLRIFNDQQLLLGIATCELSNQANIQTNSQSHNCQARILIPNERGLPATRLRIPIFF